MPPLPLPPQIPDLPDAMATPGVPFAASSAATRYWPVRTSNPKGREVAYLDIHHTQRGAPGRDFLAIRDDGRRHHVAVDLWGDHGDTVVACEDGEIVHFYPFYNGVNALIVQCDSGLVINYGEVDAGSLEHLGLKKGERVKAGDPIATVGRMTSGGSMCHFETYITGTTQNHRWLVGEARPDPLLNPTAYLVQLARTGL
jgi:murein DD-endopeptidase MepM/ murein hydrolase activator NlpD